jgi:nucleoside-diphosphate-sugar epimerase
MPSLPYAPASIALTGATGSLGFAFLAAMIKKSPGVRAILLARTTSAAFTSEAFQSFLRRHRDRITIIEGDLTRLQDLPSDAIRRLVSTDGGLWHFAASTKLRPGDSEVARETHELNDVGTRRLLDLFAAVPNPGPFHYLSTAYVVGDRGGLATEDELDVGQGFRNDYEASKLRAERHVRAAMRQGLRAAIYRPSIVMEDSPQTGTPKIADIMSHAIATSIRRRQPFIFRLPIAANANLVHVDWVIAALYDLAGRSNTCGTTYHLTASSETRFADICAWVRHYIPSLEVAFDPSLERSELPTGSKILDRAIEEIRSYFTAGISFDRSHAMRDLAPHLQNHALDLPMLVSARLRDQGLFSAEAAA